MKSKPNISVHTVAGFASAALFLAIVPAAAFADRGGGSVRAAARPAPPPRAAPESRAPQARPPEQRPPEQRPPEQRPPEQRPPEQRPPEARPPEARPDPPHVQPPPRPDWDDNDDDAKSWGGFAHGVPTRTLRGTRVHDLPPSHRIIIINNRNYICDDQGAFYLQQPEGDYLVVQPPVGAGLPALPDGAYPIVGGPTTYYYLDGVFYVFDAPSNSYLIVNPPPGIVVPVLPTGATQTIIDGNVIYQFNGFNYAPTIDDGVTDYTVNPS